MINVNVRNLDRIKAKLDKLPAGMRGVVTTEAAKYLIGNERRGLQYYPPPPASSRYQRTYKLRFGWQVSAWGDRTKTRIQNRVKYAPYVQGDYDQAWMHKGRWRTVSKVISDNMKGVMNAINEAVARYLRGEGLGK